MYCPPEQATNPTFPSIEVPEDVVRVLYVGRLCFTTKGTDTLLRAWELRTVKGATLDIVGDYGPDAEAVHQWAPRSDHVRMRGTVPTRDLLNVIQDFDLVVVPSAFDGWNVTVNLALRAGVPVLATPDSVSADLVHFSGAGEIFPTGDSDALASSLDKAVSDPAVLQAWTRRAEAYRDRVSPQTVGAYLAGCLEFSLGVAKRRPTPPWEAPQ
ncbi:glycosyltransferase family 4 protein [Janibacter hoylei]